MELRELRVRNFRCFKDELSIDFEKITALIGKNDSGKSSLMDALDIFLNEDVPDKDDGSKNGDPSDLTIICEFDHLPSSLIIDEDNPTNLANEWLLNSEDRLEIHKKYSGNLQKPKCTAVSVLAVHPTNEGANDLLQLKNSELGERANELGISMENIDQRINAQIRKLIWDNMGGLSLELSEINLMENNGQRVWAGLKNYLPAYALFKSDRPSLDQDSEIQDPLNIAVKEALKSKKSELESITAFVRDEVQKLADATLDKIREMDPTLANELNPIFIPPKWDKLFKASITGDDDIPMNKRGSGVRRIILLNFFRAKAEQLASDKDLASMIYAIEEPETSQHPNNQRMLLRALADLSSESQVIVSTHTPMLARALPDNCLRYINVATNGEREILVGGNDTNSQFAKSLGVLPDNNVKLFIGVEGPRDISFLQGISKALIKDGTNILDLGQLELDGEIIFFPLGGSTLALWSSRLENLNRPEFHLCDRDTTPPEDAKYQGHVDQVNTRDRCKARSTKKKEIENYLHKDAIEKAYELNGISLSIQNNFDDFDDVPFEIAKLIHELSESAHTWDNLSEEQKEEKESRTKKILNSIAPNYMTKSLLDEIDPDGDLIAWFEDMRQLKEMA